MTQNTHSGAAGANVVTTNVLTGTNFTAGGTITANTVNCWPFVQGTTPPAPPRELPTSPELPPVRFETADESGTPVTMTLRPEGTITNAELMRLVMLLASYDVDELPAFSVHAYARRHSLERHFAYGP
jgi:hypothetical protein